MRVHTTALSAGISRTPEFHRKGLADFGANVGTKCGHSCSYCSTGAMLRCHSSFKDSNENPFELGFAIVDPGTPKRVARDAATLRQRGLVQLCTTVDAWSPEGQEYGLGRKCLEAILSQPGWTVRILTKNAAVRNDFDLIERHRDRVLVGLSLTATPSKAAIMKVVEPYASTIQERMDAISEANRRGLRTYAMLCPLLPGISDSAEQIEELTRFVSDCSAEEVFAEPINTRGKSVTLTEEVLRGAGYTIEADNVGAIRHNVAC
jgi:DNA repair photolyase